MQLWNMNKKEINSFIELANSYHPTIKFTAEISSDKEITFLDTRVYKGERFRKESVLDVRTHFKPTETFQYTHFSSCHPPGVRRSYIKGEALNTERSYITRLRCSACQSQIPTDGQCFHLIGLFTQV